MLESTGRVGQRGRSAENDFAHEMKTTGKWVQLTIVVILAAIGAMSPIRAAEGMTDGEPVTIPRARQYDITSQINGQSYRLMVSTPFGADGEKAYPVLWLLDGNQYFGTATDALTRQAFLRNTAPAIIVGVAYPTDDPREIYKRRAFDMTLSRDPTTTLPTGGGDNFIRVIEEEFKPFVFERYRCAGKQQIVFGQSLGGIIALRILFRRPSAFSTYVLSSPSIFNNREVLDDEAAFAARAQAGGLALKIMITSAGDEQYRGDDPTLLAEAEKVRMVDNASELAGRLASLDSVGITVVRTIFTGEIHNTVPQAVLSRTLRFALPLTGP